MAAGTLNLRDPRTNLYEAIVSEIRSWSELPRRIFTQVHYAGKSVEDVAQHAGFDTGEVLRILAAHETKLRKSLRCFRT